MEEKNIKERRAECIKRIDKINSCSCKKDLEKIENEILEDLKMLPNFKSDMYEPLSLAIQLISLKKQSFSSSRQFIINILLAIGSISTGLIIGIIQICKTGVR